MTSVPKRRPIVVLPPELSGDGPVSLLGYQRAVQATDRLPPGDLNTPILGLFGEVGSLLAVVKKVRRDAASYAAYDAALLEEFGDVLWYFTCIVSRAGLDLSVLCQRVFRDIPDWDEVQPNEFGTWDEVQEARPAGDTAELWLCIGRLAELAGELVGDLLGGRIEGNRDRLSGVLLAILRALIAAAQAANIRLDLAVRGNLEKTFSRYPLTATYPPLADGDMPHDERLPRRLEMFIEEHEVNGKTYVIQKCNGVILGDRLTDNKAEEDDYRFHDVFHMAYAAHLGWSPVLRALLHAKRKSVPRIDENEDGQRAVLIEEGIATFIFGRALRRRLFEGLDQLDLDLLKLVQEFARGFEPERCALWQWERAILDGFSVFRELKKHRRGYVTADLEAHALAFRPATKREEVGNLPRSAKDS